MSIIAEALKKAEKASLSTKKDSLTKESIQKKPLRPKASSMRLYAVIAIAGLTAVSLGALPFFLRKAAVDNEPAERPFYAIETNTVPQDKDKEPEPAIAILPVITLAEVDESLKLSGIMYTPEKPLAVINNNIWGEGDTIGKFKITRIGRDFIKVDSSGQEFVVKLKR